MSNTAEQLPQLMCVTEFLDWPGDGSETRYELVDGLPRAMAPPSDTHGTIQSRLTFLLTGHLDKARPNCRAVVTPGVQPRLRAEWNYRNPDLGVTCAPNAPGIRMMPQPLLLIELLSPSNAKETWNNIPYYASLPSVMEILVVHTTIVRAELLRRDEAGDWPDNPAVIETGGQIGLSSIDANFAMEKIYADTHLAGAS